MSRLTRDGTAEPVSRDQSIRRERRQGNIHFSCLADSEQDWQAYPVVPYFCYMCDYTYIHHTYSCRRVHSHIFALLYNSNGFRGTVLYDPYTRVRGRRRCLDRGCPARLLGNYEHSDSKPQLYGLPSMMSFVTP